MKKIFMALIVGASCAGAAHAATMTTTATFSGNALIYDPATDYSPGTGYSPPTQLGGYDGLLTLQGFNTALGTLNSVSLTESLTSSLEFKQAFPYGDSEELNADIYVTGQTPYGGVGFFVPYSFSLTNTVPHQTYDTGVQYVTSPAGPPYINIFPSTFTPFLNGNVYVPVLGYVGLQPSTGSFLGDATSSYSYTLMIDYDYTPFASTAAPEPRSWALMLAGICGVGLMLRRTRSERASAPSV